MEITQKMIIDCLNNNDDFIRKYLLIKLYTEYKKNINLEQKNNKINMVKLKFLKERIKEEYNKKYNYNFNEISNIKYSSDILKIHDFDKLTNNEIIKRNNDTIDIDQKAFYEMYNELSLDYYKMNFDDKIRKQIEKFIVMLDDCFYNFDGNNRETMCVMLDLITKLECMLKLSISCPFYIKQCLEREMKSIKEKNTKYSNQKKM